MQDYDVVLKMLLQKSLQRLTGTTITRWLSTELPTVQNLRIDLLGETADRELMQIEVQSTNDSGIPFRMLEYLVIVTRIHGRVPKQILLYVGRRPLHMASQFQWAGGVARFTLIDIREIDGEPLLASPEPSDNVLGILARLENHRAALRGIIEKLSRLQREEAEFYFQALLVLAGLRGLEVAVQEEARNMLSIDLSENKVLGPAYQRGLQEGREEGRQEGQIDMLRGQIERKFGALPSWAEQHLAQCSGPALKQIALRVVEAESLEDLLR
jgi:predicted transposase YdaD